MNELPYTPTPYAERKSQNLTLGGYIKHMWKEALYPLLGWGVGKAASYAATDPINKKLLSLSGTLAGIFMSFYSLWKKEEKETLGVEEIYQETKQLDRLRITDEGLRKDNALVEKMIAHERAKREKLTQQRDDTGWEAQMTETPSPSTSATARA